MSYLPLIPAATDDPSVSQSQIQTNFSLLNSVFGVDHVNYTAGSNNGLHTKVTLVTAGDPAQSVAGPELYAKSVSYPGPTTKAEVFFQRASGDGAGIVQLTQSFSAPVIAPKGSTFLPGGVIIKWGTGAATVAGTVNNFASAFPNVCWVADVYIDSSTVSSIHSVWVSAKSTTGFTCKSDSGTLGIGYIAIGN